MPDPQSPEVENPSLQNPCPPPEAESIPLSPVPDAGLTDLAGAIDSAAKRNADLSAEASSTSSGSGGGASIPDDVNLHPVKWYETDLFGRVKRRADGSPIKKPHRPGKPKPGDKLVGGGAWTKDGPQPGPHVQKSDDPAQRSTFDRGGESASRVVVDSPRADLQNVNPAPDALGPEAGEVVTEALFNVSEAMHGEKAKPTEAERTSIKRAAGRVLGGIHLHPALALAILGGVYLARIAYKGKPANGSNASSHRGADPERQDGIHETPLFKYPD